MADVELLPLPDWMECLGEISAADIRDYARANVAHATAAKDAEIEPLRAEVELWRHKAAVHQYRRKKLAEAGRRVTAAFRALGEATAWTRAAEQARYECEAAMLALDAALAQEDRNG